jgi:hypothetical protein
VTCFGGAVLVLFGFNRPAFLLGHVYPKGVWFYYPVVFVLKAPLGFLGLLLLQLWLGVYRGKKGLLAGLQVEWRVLWVTLVVFTVVCVLSGFDINIRHFSVPITLLILLLAPMPGLIGEIRFGWVAVAALVASCLMITALAWPWYLPYVNALGSGRPAYELMSDSNVDWNQALPEVERFTERHGLANLPLDSYGLSDDTFFVPKSHVWDCQAPAQRDAGRWVVVSANMILDSHNCAWLLRYSREVLAGGSMYGFQLPSPIPPDGAPGGPPRAADRRAFLWIPFDFKAVTLQLLRHPEGIPEAMKQMQEQMAPKGKS